MMEAPPIQPNPTQQVVIIQQAAGVQRPRVYERYPSKVSKLLGIIRILIGAFSICLQIAAIVLSSNRNPIFRYYRYQGFSFSGTGIWCGIFFILAGSFGVAAAKYRTFCLIVTNLVLSIISVSVFATTMFFTHVGAVIAASEGLREYEEMQWSDRDYYSRYYSDSTSPKPILAIYCLLLICAFCQAICDLMSSVICCKNVCCCTSPPQNAPNAYPSTTVQGHQVLYINNPNSTVMPNIPVTATYQMPSTGPTAAPAYASGQDASAPPAYTPRQDEKHPLP